MACYLFLYLFVLLHIIFTDRIRSMGNAMFSPVFFCPLGGGGSAFGGEGGSEWSTGGGSAWREGVCIEGGDPYPREARKFLHIR